ncbi:unnamed protein product [Durusdinium trenchii]|uniref:Uncharacterized protein n=2 Tax=Durusdinium trenchii TaxID=1381693 RepID=A0ABP0SUV1_9DINO
MYFLLCLSGLLLIIVVLLGCGNDISKQVASVSLSKRYVYMLGFWTAVGYVPLFWAILLTLLKTGAAPWSLGRTPFQLKYMWQPNGHLPPALLIVLAAFGDALGDVIGAICTSHVSGPLHSLVSNCSSIFVALLSMCMLHQRYSFFQVTSLLGVFFAVVIGILPSFESDATGSNPFFAVVLGGSCVFNAFAFVVKELIFTRYKTWRASENHLEGGASLNMFLINSHEAIFQLPLTLLLIPLNVMLKQTSEGNLFHYLQEAMRCVFSGDAASCGPDSSHGELAGRCLLVYVVFNLLMNMGILLAVKHAGALATFVALKAIFPVSTVLFEYVDWPLLPRRGYSHLIWVSMAILLPSIACYQWASQLQAARAQVHPSFASCCWPWRKKDADLGSELMLS